MGGKQNRHLGRRGETCSAHMHMGCRTLSLESARGQECCVVVLKIFLLV